MIAKCRCVPGPSENSLGMCIGAVHSWLVLQPAKFMQSEEWLLQASLKKTLLKTAAGVVNNRH